MGFAVLECAGIPRDLGVTQGSAWAEGIGLALESEPGLSGPSLWRARWLPPAPATLRLEQDLWRHYPALAERMTGISLAAHRPWRLFLRALAREAGWERSRRESALSGFAVALASDRSGGSPRIVKLFDAPGSAAPLLRRSESDGGLPSLDVTLPWLPSCVAGVNAGGLALAVSARPARRDDPRSCWAPAFLLAQDCLQRFSTAEAAVDWWRKRPGGGVASLVAADASGHVTGVLARDDERRVLEPENGVLIGLGPEPERSLLAKACRAGDSIDAETLARIAAQVARGDRPIAVVLEPDARRVGLARVGEALDFSELRDRPAVRP